MIGKSFKPYIEGDMEPNFWLSCALIDKDYMTNQVRSDNEAMYEKEPGKTCPTEILDELSKYNIEGRPIWKPMHMQPIYRMNPFITADGDGRCRTNAYIKENNSAIVNEDIFHRGLCLPSDIKMTEEEQDVVIEIIKKCFE